MTERDCPVCGSFGSLAFSSSISPRSGNRYTTAWQCKCCKSIGETIAVLSFGTHGSEAVWSHHDVTYVHPNTKGSDW